MLLLCGSNALSTSVCCFWLVCCSSQIFVYFLFAALLYTYICGAVAAFYPVDNTTLRNDVLSYIPLGGIVILVFGAIWTNFAPYNRGYDLTCHSIRRASCRVPTWLSSCLHVLGRWLTCRCLPSCACACCKRKTKPDEQRPPELQLAHDSEFDVTEQIGPETPTPTANSELSPFSPSEEQSTTTQTPTKPTTSSTPNSPAVELREIKVSDKKPEDARQALLAVPTTPAQSRLLLPSHLLLLLLHTPQPQHKMKTMGWQNGSKAKALCCMMHHHEFAASKNLLAMCILLNTLSQLTT